MLPSLHGGCHCIFDGQIGQVGLGAEAEDRLGLQELRLVVVGLDGGDGLRGGGRRASRRGRRSAGPMLRSPCPRPGTLPRHRLRGRDALKRGVGAPFLGMRPRKRV